MLHLKITKKHSTIPTFFLPVNNKKGVWALSKNLSVKHIVIVITVIIIIIIIAILILIILVTITFSESHNRYTQLTAKCCKPPVSSNIWLTVFVVKWPTSQDIMNSVSFTARMKKTPINKCTSVTILWRGSRRAKLCFWCSNNVHISLLMCAGGNWNKRERLYCWRRSRLRQQRNWTCHHRGTIQLHINAICMINLSSLQATVPVDFHIKFNIATFTLKVLTGSNPRYVADLLPRYEVASN